LRAALPPHPVRRGGARGRRCRRLPHQAGAHVRPQDGGPRGHWPVETFTAAVRVARRVAYVQRIDVRFRDIDALDHVNHAVILTYAETVRCDWFATQLGHASMAALPF